MTDGAIKRWHELTADERDGVYDVLYDLEDRQLRDKSRPAARAAIEALRELDRFWKQVVFSSAAVPHIDAIIREIDEKSR